MPKRSSRKNIKDTNVLAAHIVEKATSGSLQDIPKTKDGKNAYAVGLGRLGGLKGGKARAERLAPARRIEIARKAAEARWSKQP